MYPPTCTDSGLPGTYYESTRGRQPRFDIRHHDIVTQFPEFSGCDFELLLKKVKHLRPAVSLYGDLYRAERIRREHPDGDFVYTFRRDPHVGDRVRFTKYPDVQFTVEDVSYDKDGSELVAGTTDSGLHTKEYSSNIELVYPLFDAVTAPNKTGGGVSGASIRVGDTVRIWSPNFAHEFEVTKIAYKWGEWRVFGVLAGGMPITAQLCNVERTHARDPAWGVEGDDKPYEALGFGD